MGARMIADTRGTKAAHARRKRAIVVGPQVAQIARLFGVPDWLARHLVKP